MAKKAMIEVEDKDVTIFTTDDLDVKIGQPNADKKADKKAENKEYEQLNKFDKFKDGDN